MLAWLLACVTLSISQCDVEDPLDILYTYREPFTNPDDPPIKSLGREIFIKKPLLLKLVLRAFDCLTYAARLCGVQGINSGRTQTIGELQRLWQLLVVDTLTITSIANTNHINNNDLDNRLYEYGELRAFGVQPRTNTNQRLCIAPLIQNPITLQVPHAAGSAARPSSAS